MPAISVAYILLGLACALLAQSASAKPVSRNALDRCVLRGGTIKPFGDGKSCCYTDNSGLQICIACKTGGLTCEQYGVPAPGTKR
jgi:hypothetical protein